MLAEYEFDYTKAKSNRFADISDIKNRVIVLDPDIAKIFTTSESVNKILRSIISAIPENETKYALPNLDLSREEIVNYVRESRER
jgi:hypothetical protein